MMPPRHVCDSETHDVILKTNVTDLRFVKAPFNKTSQLKTLTDSSNYSRLAHRGSNHRCLHIQTYWCMYSVGSMISPATYPVVIRCILLEGSSCYVSQSSHALIGCIAVSVKH